MSELVERARAWMAEVHPHFRHMERTLHWADWIDPGASEAVRIAAVTHDAERAYPDPDVAWDSAVSWDDPDYNRWHQERCARIVAEWLREQDVEPALADEVEALVRVHEEGGWPEADVVQAADSLSFLETMVGLVGAGSSRGAPLGSEPRARSGTRSSACARTHGCSRRGGAAAGRRAAAPGRGAGAR